MLSISPMNIFVGGINLYLNSHEFGDSTLDAMCFLYAICIFLYVIRTIQNGAKLCILGRSEGEREQRRFFSIHLILDHFNHGYNKK